MSDGNTTGMNTTQTRDRKGAFLGVFAAVFLLTFGLLYMVDFYPELVWPEDQEQSGVIVDGGDSGDTSGGITMPRLTFNTVTPTAVESTDTNATTTEEGSIGEETADSEDVSGTTSVSLPTEVALGARESDADPYPLELTIESLGKTVTVLNPTSRRVADLDAALLEGVVRHPDSATFTNEGNIFILGHSSYLPNVLNRNYQAFNGIQNLQWGDAITIRSKDTEYTYRVDKVYEAKADQLTVPIAGTGPRLTLATCDSFGSKDDRYIVEATLVGQKRL